jgi:hypothetical protein
LWWIKFQIDINHHLAWKIVQEFGHVVRPLELSTDH